MNYEKYIHAHEAFFFGFDNVLYPEKDYLLQVYYLFAQFIEYGEQKDAQEITGFMRDTYTASGAERMFDLTAARFGLPEKYRLNFDLLHQNARLPLKLLLFANVLDFMQAIMKSGKPLYLLAEGDPATQLNKIRQTEWNGLETVLKVYFVAENAEGTLSGTVRTILAGQTMPDDAVLMIGQDSEEQDFTNEKQIKFLSTSKLSLP